MAVEHLIARTKANLEAQRFTTLLAERPNSGLYLFFSFDLVNSTQFKASNTEKWPVVVIRFYELVTAALSTRLTSAILWKYVGDEVLFYKRVVERKDLHQALPIAFDALNISIDSLHKEYPETREILSVKATVWLAVAEFIQPSDIGDVKLKSRNIIIPTGRPLNSLDRDFLGPDLDVGFRISKFALRRRLVVSAHLAWLLYNERGKCPEIEQQLKIVGFESLKGVWNGRHYPIIWFEKDWGHIKGTFLYDEHFGSEIIRNLKAGLDPEGELSKIDKVFSDLGKNDEITAIVKAVDALNPLAENDLVEIEIPRDKYSEVHCVAICFSAIGEALAAKRPSLKKRFPNAWEFGCGQLKLGETFGECLRRAYKNDFGVDLEIDDYPAPICTFGIQDSEERRNIPGIIFVARINDKSMVENKFSREKHSAIAWIDPVTFSPIDGHEYVPAFAETLRLAHAALDRLA